MTERPSGQTVVPPAEADAKLDAIVRSTRCNLVLTVGAASAAPILYLIFLEHFSINSLYDDDWSVAPLIRNALGGHFSLSQLWAQHFESRLVLGNAVGVLFGYLDRYDTRSVIFFSAAVFIASYGIVLTLFRRYLRTRLTPIPVLAVGVIWFSLADVQNPLWAFQVSWYLTVLFFVAMLWALQIPLGNRSWWFAVGGIAAVAASLSTVQGFLCWPVGVICILWSQSPDRRWRHEIAVWSAAAVLTLVLYLPGYQFGDTPCGSGCSPGSGLHHPVTTLGFLLALIGGVVPGGIDAGGVVHTVGSYRQSEVLGVVVLLTALFILGQSVRHRRLTEAFPLPLLLITFSLLFDLTIALGRGAGGSLALGNRYVMPNLILLVGIVVYASAHIQRPGRSVADDGRRNIVAWIGLGVLGVFLIVQVIGATEFGLTNGRTTSKSRTDQARLAVNEDRLPANPPWRCEVFAEFQFQPSWSPSRVRDAAAAQLGEFQPSWYRRYRQLGLPTLVSACRHFTKAEEKLIPPPPR